MELSEILYRLQRLAEPNGLTTSDIEWAETQLTEWRDREVAAARIAEWEKMVEFMKPPEMHLSFKWPCPFCGLAPITMDNARLLELSKDRSEDE